MFVPETRLMDFCLTILSLFFSESGYQRTKKQGMPRVFCLVLYRNQGKPTNSTDNKAKLNKRPLQLVKLRDVKPSTIKPKQKPVEVGSPGSWWAVEA